MNKILQKRFIIFVIVALGILIAFVLNKSRSPLEHANSRMASKKVDVITVSKIPFHASVTAYGSVEPSIMIKGMAEVSGKASYVNPRLKQGNSLPQGTVVVRIDPEDYKLSLKQTQADLKSNKSSLSQLEEEEKSIKQSLALAQKNLQVGEKEMQRIKGVFDKGLVARSAVDSEEQKVLQLKQQVEDMQGKLNTFASRRESIQAQIDRAEQIVKGQKTTLGRTEITLPFDARIGKVSIEKGEFVNVGTPLFEAFDLTGVEINAQLAMKQMVSLLLPIKGRMIAPISPMDVPAAFERINLTAQVRLVGGSLPKAIWDARVLRFSDSIDPTRRTIGIVVGVDNPYEKMIVGERPPLLKGMYTAVKIMAPATEAYVIPRKALHQGRVYVADRNNQLVIKAVDVEFEQGNLAVITDGLQSGETLIINDLVPVIEGMPLEPDRDSAYEEKLKLMAMGE